MPTIPDGHCVTSMDVVQRAALQRAVNVALVSTNDPDQQVLKICQVMYAHVVHQGDIREQGRDALYYADPWALITLFEAVAAVVESQVGREVMLPYASKKVPALVKEVWSRLEEYRLTEEQLTESSMFRHNYSKAMRHFERCANKGDFSRLKADLRTAQMQPDSDEL